MALLNHEHILEYLGVAELAPILESEAVYTDGHEAICLRIKEAVAEILAPEGNTLGLRRKLPFNTRDDLEALRREVVVALLLGPRVYQFPSLGELESAVNIRCNIARAAQRTVLTFGTSQANRPDSLWIYNEDKGFLLRNGASLVEALTKATQPAYSEPTYSFSCYRATEYVILLGLALELRRSNPRLYEQLELVWAHRSIKSAQFHDVFLREHGSMAQPLPGRYFVPGDRVWFRNPDPLSANVTGYEGSWLIYLGDGLFSNFWTRGRPYSIVEKYLEIYHWRDAITRSAEGVEEIDEMKVARLVEASLNNPQELARITAMMQRYREPRGCYTQAGGCLDTSREVPRWVRPESSDIELPAE